MLSLLYLVGEGGQATVSDMEQHTLLSFDCRPTLPAVCGLTHAHADFLVHRVSHVCRAEFLELG